MDAYFASEMPKLVGLKNVTTNTYYSKLTKLLIQVFFLSFLGKTKTMIGSCESPFALGVIPCAISWLYRAVSEQKQKTGARFSIRVSAVEITAVSQQIRDLLTDYASGK